MARKSSAPGVKTGFRFSEVRDVVERSIKRRLGARLTLVTPKKVSAEMPIKPAHLNIDGRRVNGGLIMAFADTVGAIGAMVNLAPGEHTSTLESKTNFFAAGEGPVISATAVPLHVGRTTMVWQTTVSNPDGRRVAIVTQTQIVLQPRPGPGARPDAAPAVRPLKRATRKAARMA
jgi:uncharacterized protein (TIGR00369 family)